MKAISALATAAAMAGAIALGLWLGPGEQAAAPARPALTLTPQTRAPVPRPTPPRATVLTRRANGHFAAAATVNGRPVAFVIDTGATVTALSPADARAAGIAFDSGRFAAIGTGAGGVLYGQRIVIGELAIDGRPARDVAAVVIDRLPVSLLGQSYLRTRGGVRIARDTMILE